jgi:hypothetical protein
MAKSNVHRERSRLFQAATDEKERYDFGSRFWYNQFVMLASLERKKVPLSC